MAAAEQGTRARRRDVLALALGVVLTLMGVAGVVVSLVAGRHTAATGSVVWLLIGVLVLIAGVRSTGRERRPG